MQSITVRSRVSLALVPLLVLVTSCGDKSDDKEAASCDASQAAVSSATYDELWTKVFSTQCGACHGNEAYSATVGGPDLRTQDSFHDALVGKTGSVYDDWDTFQKNRGADCNATSFIAAGSAATSMVVAVLDPTTKITGCDPLKSHLEAPQNICITSGNLAKLKEWINAGASK